MFAIQDKSTKELDKERFNTKHEAEVSLLKVITLAVVVG